LSARCWRSTSSASTRRRLSGSGRTRSAPATTSRKPFFFIEWYENQPARLAEVVFLPLDVFCVSGLDGCRRTSIQTSGGKRKQTQDRYRRPAMTVEMLTPTLATRPAVQVRPAPRVEPPYDDERPDEFASICPGQPAIT